MRGRLQWAETLDNREHPVLIPKEFHLANLIMSDALHEEHGGTQLMVNCIRTKYWILDSRRLGFRLLENVLFVYVTFLQNLNKS